MIDCSMKFDDDEYMNFYKKPNEVLQLCRETLEDQYNRNIMLSEEIYDESYKMTCTYKSNHVFTLAMRSYGKFYATVFLDALFHIKTFEFDASGYESVMFTLDILSVWALKSYRVNDRYNFADLILRRNDLIEFSPGFALAFENIDLLKHSDYIGYYRTLKLYNIKSDIFHVHFGYIRHLDISYAEMTDEYFDWLLHNIREVDVLNVEARTVSKLDKHKIDRLRELLSHNVNCMHINLEFMLCIAYDVKGLNRLE